ncbi:MAG: hypothetical protein N2Z72_03845 [Bacteroidales bacterium]|nr:hypothetical protein [Bacteroidales bacterium]
MAKNKSGFHSKKVVFVGAILLEWLIITSQSMAWKISEFDDIKVENSFHEFDSLLIIRHKTSWIKRKLFLEHFITYVDTNLIFFVDPVFDLRLSFDKKGSYYQNTRGAKLFANYDDKILVQSEFYETQATFPIFIKNWLDSVKVIPGAVQYKPFKENGYDFGVAYSRCLVRLRKDISFYVAYDKMDLSPGYYNLWLNSTSMPYPQVGIITRYRRWHWHYGVGTLYNPDFSGAMSVPVYTGRNAFQKKWFSYNHIRFSPFSLMDMFLFESIVLPPHELSSKGLKYVYLLPSPWVRQLLASDSMYGKLTGFGWQLKFSHYRLYNSYLFTQEGRGVVVQVGGSFSFRDKGKTAIHTSIEYTQANGLAYTSAHKWTSWHHMDFPLGHPLGRRFKQLTLSGYILYGRWSLILEGNGVQQNMRERSFLIAMGDSVNDQTERTLSIKFKLNYMLNPASGISVFILPWWYGHQQNGTFDGIIWLQIGINSNMRPYWFNFW